MSLQTLIIEKAYAVKVGICPDPTNCQENYTWGSYVTAIYNYSKTIGSILVVLMLIYAGYIYLTSQGDSSKLTTAKDIVVGSLLGYLLLLLIGPILTFIGIDQPGVTP